MRAVNLIIFDLDGTLIDSRKDIANAVNFTLKGVGLKEKSVAEISSYIGTGVQDLIRKSLGERQDNLFTRALSLFEDYYSKHSTDSSSLYPDVKEVLEYFKNKRKAIVSNRKYEFAKLALKRFGLYDYFEDVVGADNVGCMKPSSCPLNGVIRKLNMDKEKTMIVGDMDIDILAGKKAGIITCAVIYGIGKEEDILKAKPDYIINNISELKKLIS